MVENNSIRSAPMGETMDEVIRSKSRWRPVLGAGRRTRMATGTLPSGHAFLEPLQGLVSDLGAKNIAMFAPRGPEPNIVPFWQDYEMILLPRLFDDDGAWLPPGAWAWWHPGDRLKKLREWAPAQPEGIRTGTLEEVDLVILPALAIDRSGTRLGLGGGWYDQALLKLRPDATAAAVVYNWELFPENTLPSEPHDVRLDWVITDRGRTKLPQGR